MRFSDFLLVDDPSDLDFIVGYTEEQNIRISVSEFFGNQILGSGNPGYIPVFTGTQTLGNSQIFQDGSNIVIGGVNAMGYRLAVGGTIYAANGAVIETTSLGADALRVISEGENIFIIPNDLGQSITSSRRIIHPPAVLTTQSATLGQVNSAILNLENDIDLLLDLKVDKTSIGVPNGVASLDSGGKVPLSQIPDSIIGQVQYMGTWNAFTNTPTLNPLIPEERGHYYVVSVAGVFAGLDFQIGDWIISNGVIWEKVDNTDAVTSVFGRIGAILALEGDYQAFYPRLSQAYDNPTFINSLAFTKITGVPAFLLENQTITLSGDVTGSGKTSIPSTISNNAVSNEKLRDSVGTSVIGRSASTTGDPADIQATTDGHVLLRSGGNLLFGLISGDSISSIDWSKITGTPTTLTGYGITNAYTKTEADNKFVPYTGANSNVNLGSNNITANSFIKAGGTSSQFLKADGSVDTSQYVPTTRSVNAGTGLTGGGNLSSDITIAFDTTWGDNRYAYRTRQLTINGITFDLSADRSWTVGTVNTLTTLGTGGPATLIGNTLNIPNYTTDLSGYVTLATDQSITGLKTIVRGGDVLNFKIGTDTLYGLKIAYNQNELVPSGEATWSFVNTFNNGSGTGLTTTPISFFRGVLVTGDRLLSVSVNANLLDYYGNNPSGRYPIYAYNTGVQQFASSIIVGETNGVVNAITGSIADLPAGVVANFKGRVIGSNAVNNNEFATLGQVTSTSRAAISLTTTGTSGPATYNNTTGVFNIPEYAGTVNPSAREIQTYIATASQTTFTVTGGYTVGLVDVFINGVRLTSSDYTATNGTTVVLTVGTMAGNIVDIIKYTSGIVNSISGSGTTNELAYFTASTTIASLTTATYPSLTELSYVKGVTSSIQTQLNGKQSTLTNPVTGTGTSGTLPKFTGSTTIGNSNLINDSSGNLGLGITPSAWGTDFRAIQIGTSGGTSISSDDWNGFTEVLNNVYGSARNTYTRIQSLGASRYSQQFGTHVWYSVGAGSGGTTVSFTPVMTLTNANLLVGTSTDNGFKLDVNGTGRFSGNLGVGITSFSSWASGTENVLQVKSASIYEYGGYETGFSVNAYYNLGWKYIGTNVASQIVVSAGAFTFNRSVSGTAGNAISWIPTLTLASTGEATFSSSVTTLGSVDITGAGNTLTLRKSNNVPVLALIGATSNTLIEGGNTFNLYTGGTGNRIFVTALGNVGIGTTGGINVVSGWTNFVVNGSTTGLIGVKANEVDYGAIYASTGGNNFVIQAYGSSNAGNMLFLTASSVRLTINSTGFVSAGAITNGRLGVRGFTNDSSGYSFEAANASGNTLFIVRNDGVSTFTGNVGIGTFSPVNIGGYTALTLNNSTTGGILTFQQNGVNKGSIYNDGSSNMYFGNNSGNTIFETGGSPRMTITSGGNVLIGPTTDNGTRLRINGTAHIPTLTHEPGYHGVKVLVYGPVTSVNIDLPTEFPLMALVVGNVWTVFARYCGFEGGGVEAREFLIARNSGGGWASANYGPISQTNASLQSVTGSGNTITVNVDSGTYFTLELTVMIR